MRIMYKGGKAITVDNDQIPLMSRVGYSLNPEEVPAVEEVKNENEKKKAKSKAKPAAKEEVVADDLSILE